ncbi:hypothetical protein ACFV20_35885 [Streptomyces sp. NPDC059696]|uniref:hypothetical protein n=1 Tax=Streptomyces sp. NPDC059696 TaxID=3346911 RepID=UPI00368E66B3
MVRRRWAAMVGLVACLLVLHLAVPGLAGEGRPAAAVTAEVDAALPGAASGDGAEGAEEPCPCEDEPSVRHPAARTPRSAGAASAGPVPAGAAVAGRSGTKPRPAGPLLCPGAAASAPSAARSRTLRC